MTTLESKVSVYVPGTRHGTIPDATGQARWVDRTLTLLAACFGGATSDAPSQGAWYDPARGLIREPIVKVYSFGSPDDIDNAMPNILRHVSRMGADMGQACVGVERDGIFHLIDNVEYADFMREPAPIG